MNNSKENLMDLVAGYKQYAAAEELHFSPVGDAPNVTPTATALFTVATSKLFVSGAVVSAGGGISYRVAC